MPSWNISTQFPFFASKPMFSFAVFAVQQSLPHCILHSLQFSNCASSASMTTLIPSGTSTTSDFAHPLMRYKLQPEQHRHRLRYLPQPQQHVCCIQKHPSIRSFSFSSLSCSCSNSDDKCHHCSAYQDVCITLVVITLAIFPSVH